MKIFQMIINCVKRLISFVKSVFGHNKNIKNVINDKSTCQKLSKECAQVLYVDSEQSKTVQEAAIVDKLVDGYNSSIDNAVDQINQVKDQGFDKLSDAYNDLQETAGEKAMDALYGGLVAFGRGANKSTKKWFHKGIDKLNQETIDSYNKIQDAAISYINTGTSYGKKWINWVISQIPFVKQIAYKYYQTYSPEIVKLKDQAVDKYNELIQHQPHASQSDSQTIPMEPVGSQQSYEILDQFSDSGKSDFVVPKQQNALVGFPQIAVICICVVLLYNIIKHQSELPVPREIIDVGNTVGKKCDIVAELTRRIGLQLKHPNDASIKRNIASLVRDSAFKFSKSDKALIDRINNWKKKLKTNEIVFSEGGNPDLLTKAQEKLLMDAVIVCANGEEDDIKDMLTLLTDKIEHVREVFQNSYDYFKNAESKVVQLYVEQLQNFLNDSMGYVSSINSIITIGTSMLSNMGMSVYEIKKLAQKHKKYISSKQKAYKSKK